MKQKILFILLMIEIILILEIVHVLVSAEIASKGLELYDLQQEAENMKAENMRLYEQLLDATSLREIYRKATEQGFQEAKFLYL